MNVYVTWEATQLCQLSVVQKECWLSAFDYNSGSRTTLRPLLMLLLLMMMMMMMVMMFL